MPYSDYRSLSISTKLMAMLEATQAGTWEWNVQTGECHFNERWADIIGYTLAELEPISIATWLQSVHPEDGDKSTQALDEHFSGKRPFYECEVRVKHKSGHWVWVRDYGRVVSYTDDGDPEWMLGTHIDITSLVELRDRFETISELLPGMVYQYLQHADGRSCFPYASEGIKDIYGVTPAAVKYDATPAYHSIHPDDVALVIETIQRSAATGEDWICEYRVTPDKEERWVLGHARPQAMEGGSTSWYGMIVDITERKQLELELERSQANLKLAQRIAKTGHWEANLNTGELYWSEMVYELFEFQPGDIDLSVDFFRSLVPPQDLEAVLVSEEHTKQGGTHDVQHRIRTGSGKLIWVHELAELQADNVTLVGTVRDITEQKELELQLQEQASIDPLTHIYNRRYFQQVLTHEYQRYQRYQQPLSLITFDLDHFKRVNDTYGHAMGDAVLEQLTETVLQHLRSSDVFARIGGEEFAILLIETDQTKAQQVAEKLRQAVEAMTVHYQSDSVQVTSTFGVVSMCNKVESEQQLLQVADRALYRGKSGGRNCVVVADDSLL